MSLETDLARTFAEHEHLAPDAEQVLAGVQARTGRRRPAVRPLAVAATVVAMAAVAGGAVALTSGDTPAPTEVAASPTTTAVTSAPVSSSAAVTSSAPATVVIPTLTMPMDVGWLPDGTPGYLARRTQIGSVGVDGPGVVNGEYLLTVTSATRALDVDVQQMAGGLDGMTFKSGPGADVTIGGRAAVESSIASGPGGYEVYFLDANGHLTYVNVANSPQTLGSAVRPQAAAEELRATGRRIAESVTVPGTTQITPSFGLGYLPAGMTVVTFEVAAPFDVDSGGGEPRVGTAPTSGPPTVAYQLGTGTSPTISVLDGAMPDLGPSTAGRPVQGHPTTLGDVDGTRILTVEDAVGGGAIHLSGPVSADELYRIADGLILPS